MQHKKKRKKKECRAMPASKRRNLTTKSSSWERLEPRISCVWWNFPENGHRISPFRSRPCTFEAWLGFFDLLAISLSDVSSYLFDKKDIHRGKKNLSHGNPFSRPKFRFDLRGNVSGMKIEIRQNMRCSRFPSSYFSRTNLFHSSCL